MPDVAAATMLVTGGNTGIGFETVVGLARAGARVIFTSRQADRGEAALAAAKKASGSESIEVLMLDLASLQSIAEFAAEFLRRHDRLDVVVANAGVVTGDVRRETADGFELMFGVNHLGHVALISHLEPLLRASNPSRVVIVASGAYTMAADGLCFDDLQHEHDFHGTRVYGESKLANIWYALELAHRFEGSGVTVNALNPGFVATELGRPRAGEVEPQRQSSPISRPRTAAEQELLESLPTPVSPAIGARTSIKLATSPELEGVTGSWWSAGRPAELDALARDETQAAHLWEVSSRLIASKQ